MGRYDSLNRIINQCDQLKSIVKEYYPDIEDGLIEKFVYRVVNTYMKEVPNIDYCTRRDFGKKEGMIDSLDTLKLMLSNYKDQLEDSSKMITIGDRQPQINIHTTQTNNQKQSVYIAISLDQVIDNIYQIPDSLVSDEEKDLLIGKLQSIEKLSNTPNQDKSKIWDKAKGILLWIADKSVDAGIALLPTIPYVIQTLQNLK